MSNTITINSQAAFSRLVKLITSKPADTNGEKVDALGRPLVHPNRPRASSGTVLPRGTQWIAHEKRGGHAATRRLKQFIARGLMLCASCETPWPLSTIRLYRTAPDGSLLLVEDDAVGVDTRAICTECIPDELVDALDAREPERANVE